MPVSLALLFAGVALCIKYNKELKESRFFDSPQNSHYTYKAITWSASLYNNINGRAWIKKNRDKIYRATPI